MAARAFMSSRATASAAALTAVIRRVDYIKRIGCTAKPRHDDHMPRGKLRIGDAFAIPFVGGGATADVANVVYGLSGRINGRSAFSIHAQCYGIRALSRARQVQNPRARESARTSRPATRRAWQLAKRARTKASWLRAAASDTAAIESWYGKRESDMAVSQAGFGFDNQEITRVAAAVRACGRRAVR